jgi:hypothetical protein
MEWVVLVALPMQQSNSISRAAAINIRDLCQAFCAGDAAKVKLAALALSSADSKNYKYLPLSPVSPSFLFFFFILTLLAWPRT